MTDIKIDTQKLIFHPQILSDWVSGKTVYPIYVEISPTNLCNHRCSFCAFDYMQEDPRSMDAEKLNQTIIELAELGTRSILFAGEGEPLLYPNIVDCISLTKKTGIDAALATNGLFLDRVDQKELLSSLTWLRLSVNGTNSKNYNKIHDAKPGDYRKILKNIETLVDIKKKNKSRTTIGVQIILLPENKEGILKFARKMKNIGIDYFTVKPYSEHPMNIKQSYKDFDYSKYIGIENELKKLADNNFVIAFRKNAMLKHDTAKPYEECLGLPFFAYIDCHGNVIPCVAFIGQKKYIYGNIDKSTFKKIWNSKNRKRIINYISEKFPDDCRRICRLDEINKYLWRLKNPENHDNFI